MKQCLVVGRMCPYEDIIDIIVIFIITSLWEGLSCVTLGLLAFRVGAKMNAGRLQTVQGAGKTVLVSTLVV